jgi:uncharacterized protein (UPF0335 family)
MPDVGGIAGAQLKSFVERIERLEEEKRALGEDIKEVYAKAKGTGFEPKIMRQILKIRKMDKDILRPANFGQSIGHQYSHFICGALNNLS